MNYQKLRKIKRYNYRIMDSPYSNREIDAHFKEIKDTLSRIETQTLKTNGRVSAVEDEVIRIKTSHTIATWAFGITIPLIISMGVWVFFNQIQNTNDNLHRHIQSDVGKWDLVFEKLGL